MNFWTRQVKRARGHGRAVWFIFALTAGLIVARAPLPVATAAAGGVALVLVTLAWPPAALLALAFAVPFGPGLPLDGFRVGSTDLLVALVVGAWLAQCLAHRRVTLPRAPLLWPLLVYVLALLLSLRTAWSMAAALPELVKWLEVVVLYLTTRAFLQSPGPTLLRSGTLPPATQRSIRQIIALGLVVAAVFEAIVGLTQFFLRIGPPGFLILGRFLRAYGTFAQPNPYAGYLGLVLPLALSLTLHALTMLVPHLREPTGLRLSRLVAVLALPTGAGIILAGLLASWSRGGWLGMMVGVGVVVVLRSRRAAMLSAVLLFLLLAAVVLGLIGALPPTVSERFQGIQDWALFLRPVELRSIEITGENFALVERMAHWYAAWAMWLDSPVTGVGVGNYPVAYEAYRMPAWKEPLGHAHNILLNVMAETGLVGLAAYVLLWGWVFAHGLLALRGTRGLERAVQVGALGGLAHLTVHNLFDNLYVHGMYAYVAILLALLTSMPGNDLRPES